MLSRRIWEDVCLDLALSEVSAHAERLYWRMLSKSDDYGNLPACAKWLHGACVPLCGTTTARVALWCKELARAGLITLYDAEGQTYAHFPSFERRQPFRADYHRRRLYTGQSGQSPDNLVAPRWDKAGRERAVSREVRASAQFQNGGARERADAGIAQAQKEKEKEKENPSSCQKEKEKGGPSGPTPQGARCTETSPSPSSSPAETAAIVHSLMDCYARCHPGAFVGPEKLALWIEQDLLSIPAQAIREALEAAPAPEYYHKALRPLREIIAANARHLRASKKYHSRVAALADKRGTRAKNNIVREPKK